MKIFPLCAALSFAAIATCGAADAFKRVAYDDAGADGKQPHHLESSGDYRFPNPGTHDEALRSCAFGPSVRFGYGKLNPKAEYKAKLRFFSDAPRELRVKANDTVVLPSVVLANDKVLEIETALPSADPLLLEFECISGSGAVISDIEILSTDPTPLAVIPPPPVVLPRLSPRPVSVDGCTQPSMNLGGTWKFITKAPADLAATRINDIADWHDIQVPGEWAMQGFDVKPDTAAGYFRTFRVPADWADKRIKLRCDAVYSDATIYINGKEVGKHHGGLTPFEMDVTALAKPGEENSISLAVVSESLADKLSCASQYACHPLGGITRKITLFALPATYISRLHVATVFDKEYRDATLELDADIKGGEAHLLISLKRDPSDPSDLSDIKSSPGHSSIPVKAPAKWDNEHPNLYTLTVKLVQAGKVLETLTQKVGFRQVEIRGGQMFVNNMPVKLRGACRHEVHPLRGRSLTPELWRKDAELYRAGNCNLIRTSHYPPAEEFIEACDELGLFVELEAPICWLGHGSSDHFKHIDTSSAVYQVVLRANLETVASSYNHPSVIIRSLGNESAWSSVWKRVHAAVRQADPTRPCAFHDQCWGGGNNFGSTEMPIANYHYPNDHPSSWVKQNGRQLYFGEYCHLNAYNRLELATDPGLRDTWGRYLDRMWNNMYHDPNCLGGSIWAAMDDTFYLPNGDTVGYGTWGPLDGWRREKPEYWGMKKAYSPVRLGKPSINSNTVTLEVDNRYHFSDLSEMKIVWKCGAQSGSTTASAAPGAKGLLTVNLPAVPQPGDTLALDFIDPRGFTADQFNLALTATAHFATPPSMKKTEWTLDDKTGLLTAVNGQSVNGPHLMLLPLNDAGDIQMRGMTKVWTPFTDPCTGWQCTNVTKTETGAVVVGHYDNAEGSYTYTVKPGGHMEVSYDFTVTKAVNPRQVGLVFTLPHECETFSWERQGYWDVYPDDHIGRLKGTVKASEGFEATSVGPRVKPNHPWRLDNLPYGNNDFCSTKHNITTASLIDTAGNGIGIDGQAEQHVRCWRTATAVHVLVAAYSNAGSERFLRDQASKDDRPLKPGDKITGTVRLTLLVPKP